jgi:hypothetical protein
MRNLTTMRQLAIMIRDLRHFVSIDVSETDVGSFSQQCLANRAPDSLRCTCHDARSSRDSTHGPPSLLELYVICKVSQDAMRALRHRK